ncbi:uncharacterized protein EV154DRAFT_533634 [Mucor mucedo]|uniref:uncharacterized protein n=1 Tax=Mucor mucedo TaxID=29922 RepID=UPI00221E90E3|nr:uncharacterized protein EV154DRAFT_533634 [Mucor mucedo]KAI7865054.1 hypothetical protein EV154DRAFT_533634 [Mucor mucedo]
MTLQQEQYQLQLSAAHDRASLITPLAKPLPIGSKRDLTEILAITHEKIYQKIHDLIRTQWNDNRSLPASKLSVIRQQISRLPDLPSEQPLLEISESLLSSLQDLHAQLELSYHLQHQGIDQQKKQFINEFQSHRLAKTASLQKTLEELNEEYKESEKALVQRVRELYDDPAIQSLVIKSKRLKALTCRVKTELGYMALQPDILFKQIQKIESQDPPPGVVVKKDSVPLEEIIGLKDKILLLLETNKQIHEDLTRQWKEINKGRLTQVDQCMERIETAKLKIKKDKVVQEIDSMTPNELLETKNVMSPHTSISTIQLVNKIMESIRSVNEFEKDGIAQVCSDIRKTLDSLLEKWSTSLDKQDIPILTSVPTCHDGIDNVIQSIDAIRLNFQEKERSYKQIQQQKFQTLLQSTNTIENEILHTENALEERQLISKIGQSFIIKNKSFDEWLDELEKKN